MMMMMMMKDVLFSHCVQRYRQMTVWCW